MVFFEILNLFVYFWENQHNVPSLNFTYELSLLEENTLCWMKEHKR